MTKRNISTKPLRSKIFADLQIHTNYSDGASAPIHLLKRAKKIGLSAISFTDHHYLLPANVLAILREQSRKNHMNLIEATEISCTFRGINFHLLAYSKKFRRTAAFRKLLNSMHTAYDKLGNAILKKITSEGYPISKADFRDYFYTYLHKNLIYDVCGKKYSLSRDTIRDMHLPSAIRMVPFSLAAKAVREANGLPVLAHPGSFYKKMSPEKFEIFLRSLVSLGLGGIEIYHYKNSDKKMLRIIKSTARKYGLALTGGSDYHSDAASGSPVGTFGLNRAEFENFYQKLL